MSETKMYVYTVQVLVQISSGTGAAWGHAAVVRVDQRWVGSIRLDQRRRDVDTFLGHSARLSYERTSRTRATRDVYDDAPDDEDGV